MSPSEESYERVRGRLGAALAAVLAQEGEMVTRWVAVVEVMDTGGARSAYSMAPEGSMAWDTLGLLSYGIQVEQAQLVTDGDED